MARELRPKQVAAIDELRRALREGSRRPLLMAPCGFGKTAVACHITQRYIEAGKRVIFTVPAIDLIGQTVDDFYGQGIYSIGVIQADHPMTNSSRLCQIASLQTLSRRNVEPPAVVMVDEAHRRDKALTALMRHPDWQKTIFIGLSATPWAKGLGVDYDRLIIAATTDELIKDGWLSPFRCFAPAHPDLSGVKIVAGEYQNDQLSEAMQAGSLVGDIVETWLRLGEDRPTIAFGVNCAHAMAIQTAFQRAGISCAYQDANTPREERLEIAKGFRAGKYKIAANVGTLTTGIDWDVRCIIYARPTKSEMLYVQSIGRGLRPVWPAGFDPHDATAEERREAQAQGPKGDCIILDHSDTTLNLGFVTDILHESLDDGRKKTPKEREKDDREKAEPKPKECPSCSYLKPPRVHVCPSCGFAPRPADTTAVVDGELVQLNGRKNVAISEQNFYAQLLCYGNAKGYKPGWAWHKYAGKIGHPPDPALRRVPPAAEVSREVASWIKADLIRWIKAKERDAA